MDALRREEIEAQAMLLLRSHFDFLSEGRLEEAKKQLLWPSGAPGKPEQIYVETMGRTAPLRVLSMSVRRFEDIKTKHGAPVATIWIDVAVAFSLGERSTYIVVWWSPENGSCRIAARPSHWVLEKLHGDPWF
jgi:hypothetical protein